ncbi:thioesterase domain-containing protein [Plantactinospora veratri]
MRVLRDGPGRTLVCIPYAGGSCGAFTRLARHLPGSWRVVAGEATYSDGATIADAARAWWRASTPYLSDQAVLFGHSLGAVLAAAVADAAGDGLGATPVVLSAPPVLPGTQRPALVSDDDETLLAGLRSTGLLPTSGLTPEEVTRLLLPRFRRDIALAPEGFQGWGPGPCTCCSAPTTGSAPGTRSPPGSRSTGSPACTWCPGTTTSSPPTRPGPPRCSPGCSGTDAPGGR